MPLAIDRWHQALALRGPQRAPQAVPDHAEALARGAGPSLAAALYECLARHAGEVIRIRGLDIALAIDVGRPRDEATPVYAAALARGIADAIAGGGGDVVRFADRGAYHAAFAVALAAGDAHRRWVFDEFDGLASIPPAAALRTLVEREPAGAWPLLARLAREPSVFAMLEGAEALRVLDVLVAEAPGASARAGAPRLPPPSVLACPAAAVLERLARAAAAGAAIDRALLAATLSATLATPSTRARTDNSASAVATHAALKDRLHALAPMAHAEGSAPASTPPHAPVADPRPSPFADETPCAAAGLVVLLDEIDAWLDAALPQRGALALAALAAAATADDAPRVWSDASWRALLGVDPALDIGDLAESLAAADPQDAANAAASVAASASRGAARRWRDAHGDVRGVDAATGLWRDAADAAPADRACWRRAGADAAALDHPLLHALPPAWRALAVAGAQFAWRRVAWRVPGMRDSSLHYLRRNLLGGDGSALRTGDDGWHWRVTRAPLHVLLAMTTLAAHERRWRGPPERRLTLEFHG